MRKIVQKAKKKDVWRAIKKEICREKEMQVKQMRRAVGKSALKVTESKRCMEYIK
jgi:hypothetical protein